MNERQIMLIPSVGKEQDNAPTAHDPDQRTTRPGKVVHLEIEGRLIGTTDEEESNRPRRMDQAEMSISQEMARLIDNLHLKNRPSRRTSISRSEGRL